MPTLLSRPRGVTLGSFLSEATPEEAQLALSFFVWPDEYPDPPIEWEITVLSDMAAVDRA